MAKLGSWFLADSGGIQGACSGYGGEADGSYDSSGTNDVYSQGGGGYTGNYGSGDGYTVDEGQILKLWAPVISPGCVEDALAR